MRREPYEFSSKDVWDKVSELAKANPDFVYRPEIDPTDSGLGEGHCSYLTGRDGVGCIVGQALSELGVTRADLEKYEGGTAVQVVSGLRGYDINTYTRELGDTALERAQSNQDCGKPWGEAVSEAIEYLGDDLND